MQKVLKAAVILFTAIFLASCSSTNNCVLNGNYSIDYFSGGGFTGFEHGLTIHCDGMVKFWERKPNSSREITDSLKLSDDRLKRINELMKSPELFSYSHEFVGNYTTNLSLSKGKTHNTISFNPTEMPADMPVACGDLISELKKLVENKGVHRNEIQ